jgi:hypothetical protein
MYCPDCDSKSEFYASGFDEYEESIKGVEKCESCGSVLRADFSREARNAYAPVVDFRPHYSYSLGKRVETKSQMFNEAAKQGVKLNRSY